MSKVFIEEETLIGIGNAIRKKSGTTDLIATTDMATAISNLPTSGGELKYDNTLKYSTPGTTQGKTITVDVSTLGIDNTTPFVINLWLQFSTSGSSTHFIYLYDGEVFTPVYQGNSSKYPSSLTISDGVITVQTNSNMYFMYDGTKRVIITWLA